MAESDRQPLAYPANLDPDEGGGLVVTFPDFGVGVTQGETREEALTQAADLLETMVANYMAEGWGSARSIAAVGRPAPCWLGAARRRQGGTLSGDAEGRDRQGGVGAPGRDPRCSRRSGSSTSVSLRGLTGSTPRCVLSVGVLS